MESITIQNQPEFLSQRKIEMMIEAINNNVYSEVENIKAMIIKLNGDISEIRRKINEIPNQSTKTDGDGQMRLTENFAADTAPAQAMQGSNKNNPEDFSISKFFNFSNRR